MDQKLIIGGAVGGVIALAALAWVAFRGGIRDTPRQEAAPIPATQLQNEIQPAHGKPGAPEPKMPDGKPLPM